MRTMILVSIICFTSALSSCNAQTPKTSSHTKKKVKQDTTKELNLLDEQTKIFGQVFKLSCVSDEENPMRGANNYLDMINKMDASEELKEQIREIYNLYDTSLDPTKKAELKRKVTQMLENAKAKTLSEQ